MIKVKAKVTLYSNLGQKTQRITFQEGEYYDYNFLDSGWQRHIVYPKEGMSCTFNEEEFVKYFSFK